MGGRHGAQIVGGLQAANPGQLVRVIELFARAPSHVNVERLGLVNPLLTTRGGFHQPARFNLEGGGIQGLDIGRHTVDRIQGTIKVFEVHHHDIIPKPQALEVLHQVAVDDGEFTRQVGLDGQIAKAGFDGGVNTDDVGDGGGGSDGGAVGVAHAVLGNLF